MNKKRIKAINDAMSWIASSRSIDSNNANAVFDLASKIVSDLEECGELEIAEHFKIIVDQ